MIYLLAIYRYFFGFVRITISGDNPERLINYFIVNGISVWKLKRKREEIWCNVSASDFLKVMDAKHKVVGVRIKLKEKCGLPFLKRRVFKRMGVLVGLVLLVLINIALSQFIWNIDVVGCDEYTKRQIISICSEEGIKQGNFAKGIDTYTVSQRIMLKTTNVAWLSMNIEGSNLTINVSEADSTEKQNAEQTGNLVASHSGVIKLCKIIEGEKVVSNGQAVNKGDLLVSGEIAKGEKIFNVRPKGEVFADTERSFEIKVSKEYYINDETLIESKKVLKIFWLDIPLYLTGAKGEKSELTIESLEILGKKMPVELIERRFIVNKNRQTEISKEDAVNIALTEISNTLRMYPVECVNDIEHYVAEKDNAFVVTVKIKCIEDIAKFVSD